jgi:hypothetical protein
VMPREITRHSETGATESVARETLHSFLHLSVIQPRTGQDFGLGKEYRTKNSSVAVPGGTNGAYFPAALVPAL